LKLSGKTLRYRKCGLRNKEQKTNTTKQDRCNWLPA
jgi:hypothetical protein